MPRWARETPAEEARRKTEGKPVAGALGKAPGKGVMSNRPTEGTFRTEPRRGSGGNG